MVGDVLADGVELLEPGVDHGFGFAAEEPAGVEAFDQGEGGQGLEGVPGELSAGLGRGRGHG